MRKDFKAELVFLSIEQGGRITPAASGYRPHTEFKSFQGILTSGEQTYLDKDLAYSGEITLAEIKLTISDYLVGMLQKGDEFMFSEGSRLVGYGKITKILRKELDINQLPTDIITDEVVDNFNWDNTKELSESVEFLSPYNYLEQIYRNLRINNMRTSKDYSDKLEIVLNKLVTSVQLINRIKRIAKSNLIRL